MMDRAGWTLGLVAGLVGIACCVSPVVLVLLGLSSVSAISLGNTLYSEYGWYFRATALLLAAAGVVGILRRRRACSLRGAQAHWRLFVTVGLTMLIVYAILFGVTAYLDRVYAGRSGVEGSAVWETSRSARPS